MTTTSPDTVDAADAAATSDTRAPARRTSLVFHALVALGLVIGFAAWVYEIVDKPAVRLEDERVGRDGLVSTVQVLATNFSSEHDYCVEIRMTALSRGGFDIQEVPAEPTRGDGRITPGQSVNFIGTFDGLNEEDYRERLDEFQAFVDRSERC